MKISQYVYLWSNKQALITVEMNINALTSMAHDPWSKRASMLLVAEDNVIRCFQGEKDLKSYRKLGKLFLDARYFEDFKKTIAENKEISWKLFRELKKAKYQKLNAEQLFSLLKKNILQWERQMTFFRATQPEAVDALISKIRKYFSGNELLECLHPSQADITQLEARAWQKLIRLPYSNKNILAHVEKYPWIVAQHYTIATVLDTLKHRYDEDFKKQSSPVPHTKPFSHPIDRKKYPKEAETILERLNYLAWSRLEVKACFAGLDYYLIPLMEEIARRGGENIHDLQKYYLSHDIWLLLNKNEKLPSKEKKRRRDCFIGLWKNKQAQYFSGNQAEKIALQELGDLYRPKQVQQFQGVIASKGCVRGTARILGANDKERAKELRTSFQKGEILVTQMTQPNIVDIASQAGAIVTDEGGMLSHAAVISREFGIPCIVGTSIATLVLHDGDTVEVDANQGVVKIIKTT